jgi:hypothetical protein
MASTPRTRPVPRVATPWGRSAVVEHVTVPQRAGEKRFATVLELLRTERGESLVRIAYSTDGTVRRGPVTLRPRDLERLRAALAERPELSAAIGLGGGA